jgi:hypothetical protein
MASLPQLQTVDVFSAIIPDLLFVPQVHLHYAGTALPMRDGLLKLKDFPSEFRGSGGSLPNRSGTRSRA